MGNECSYQGGCPNSGSKSYENPKMFPILSSRSSCSNCRVNLTQQNIGSVAGLCSYCSKTAYKRPANSAGSCGGFGSCGSNRQIDKTVGGCGCAKNYGNQSKNCGTGLLGLPCGNCKKDDYYEKCQSIQDVIRDDDWTPRCNRRPKIGKNIKDKNLVVVNGPQGIGKTTLIKYLLCFDQRNTTITYNSNERPTTKNWVIIDTNSSFCTVLTNAKSWLATAPEGSRVFIERRDNPKTIKNQLKNATAYCSQKSKLINLTKPPYQKNKCEIIDL